MAKHFLSGVLLMWLCWPAVAEQMDAEQMDLLYLELVINGKTSPTVTAVNRSQGRWFIAAADLRAAGVKLPDTAPNLVDMKRIAGAFVVYDAPMQRLIITLPANLLPEQTLGSPQPRRNISRRDTGALLNYDVFSIANDPGRNQTSVWHDLTLFNSHVFISSTGIYRRDPVFAAERAYTRFDTHLQYDHAEQLWSLSAGDVISGGNIWTRSLRLGGLRISRDYTIDPQFITYPVPEFFGEAALPGSVELLINNQMRLSENVDAGPYVINTPTHMSGAGTAQVVTTDVQGRVTVEEIQFYASSQLLKPGLLDFDFSVGWPRENFGIASDDYADEWALSTRWRYGLVDWLTPEVVAQADPDLRLWGAASTWRAGLLGVLELSVNHSERLEAEGWQTGFGYQYHRGGLGFSLRQIERDPGYADLAFRDALRPARRERQAALSYSHHAAGTFSLGYFQFDLAQDVEREEAVGPLVGHARQELLSLSWNRTFTQGAGIYFVANRDLNSSGFDVSLTASLPLEGRGRISSTARRSRVATETAQVNWQRNTPYNGGLGWHLGYMGGDLDYYQALLDWRGTYTDLSLGSYGSDTNRHYYAGIAGALVMMDLGVFAAREIRDSFALVDVGLGNVPVYFGQQLAGQTDNDGRLLLSDLSAYAENHIAIDPMSLSAQTVFAATQTSVVPARGGGVKLNFTLENTPAALVTLVDEAGVFLPVGTELQVQLPRSHAKTSAAKVETFVVGWDGEVFLQPFTGPLTLQWPAGNCATRVLPPPPGEDLPRVGPFTCKRAQP
ncbi:MAG: fimbria/pilus outer membrane usher protein [Cellvibrionaceae bacterium]|nr:fimbria/pilus outer membrane usher protein [Cellvibrionaceae bacterium]